MYDINESFLNACRIGDVYLIKKCLEDGADITYKSYKGLTYTCAYFHTEATKFLLDYMGDEPNEINPKDIIDSMIETLEYVSFEENNDERYNGLIVSQTISICTFWKIIYILFEYGLHVSSFDKNTLVSLIYMSDVKHLIELEDRNMFEYITHDEVISIMSRDTSIYMLNFEAFIDKYLEKLGDDSLIKLLLGPIFNYVYQRTDINLYEKVGITAFNHLDDDRKITIINEIIESGASCYNRFGKYERIRILSNIGFTFDKFPLPTSNGVSGKDLPLPDNECISLLVDRWNPTYEMLENVYQTVCDNLNNTTNSSYLNYLKDRLEVKLNQS